MTEPSTEAPGAPCPTCGKPGRENKYRPFCSARCADVDLHRWLGEVYRVETDDTGDADGE